MTEIPGRLDRLTAFIDLDAAAHNTRVGRAAPPAVLRRVLSG
jgi:hypothetical protein